MNSAAHRVGAHRGATLVDSDLSSNAAVRCVGASRAGRDLVTLIVVRVWAVWPWWGRGRVLAIGRVSALGTVLRCDGTQGQMRRG